MDSPESAYSPRLTTVSPPGPLGAGLDGGSRGDGVRTQSPLMTLSTRRVRVIDSVHLSKRADVKVRFF